MSYKNAKVKPALGKQTSQWWSECVNGNERICGDTSEKTNKPKPKN